MPSENFTLWLRTIVVESSKMKKDPTSPPQFDINFRFSFQTSENNLIIDQDELWRFHSRKTFAMTEKLISLNLHQFWDRVETCEILHELLEDWPVLDSTREIVVNFVWRRTRSEIKSMVRACNIRVNLHFHLATVNTNALDEGDASTNAMISAVDPSIESLERKMMEDGERCPICMDDLCEGLSMSCCHVFHGGCIKTWLKNSHCCPLCRLEMPIAV